MYGQIRESTILPGAEAQYDAASKEFNAILAGQPGCSGSMVIDAGDGRRVRVTTWADEAAYATSSPIMSGHSERLMQPYRQGSSRIVYQGAVLTADLHKGVSYVGIRESSVKPGAQHQYDAAALEFGAILAQQPGYRGTLVVDTGDGRRVRVNAWENEAASAAAMLVMPAHSDRLMQPYRDGPSTIIYQGTVLTDDRTA